MTAPGPERAPATETRAAMVEDAPREPADTTFAAAMADAVRAYASLSAIVMNEQSLGQVLHKVAQLARDTVPGADEVSVTLIDGGRPTSVAFTGALAVALDERQYVDGFGPCMDAARTGHMIIVEDTSYDGAYPDFAAEARRSGISHTLSISIPTNQHIVAALNIYGAGPPGTFDRTAQDIATTLAGYAAIALLNAALYSAAMTEIEQLRQAMASRAGIEQAKGIIMRDRHCSADEAFGVLRDISSVTHRKLRDVALTIIADASE
jgi:GAF domain-containing protein